MGGDDRDSGDDGPPGEGDDGAASSHGAHDHGEEEVCKLLLGEHGLEGEHRAPDVLRPPEPEAEPAVVDIEDSPRAPLPAPGPDPHANGERMAANLKRLERLKQLKDMMLQTSRELEFLD